VVVIRGDLRQTSHAVNLVFAKVYEGPNPAVYDNVTASYGAANRAHLAGGMPVFMHGAGSRTGAVQTVTLSVLDSFAGYIVGKEGAKLREIQNQSGAKITMSRRGEYLPDTMSRLVTITGSTMAIQMAQMLIAQKVQQVALREVHPDAKFPKLD